MTRTLILHIGHYKTGTTALQVFCDKNAAALARRGITYAASQRHLSKHSIYAFALLRAAGVKRLMHGYARPEPPEAIWAKLLDEVRAAPTPNVLVSSEEFIRLAMAPAGVARLRAILAGAPDIAVRVIAYLRPIGPHLRSWHNQLVKKGQCQSGFQTAVATEIEAIHHDYALALAPWHALAGPGGLIVRAYDDDLRQGTRLFADFMAALGTDLPRWPVLPGGDPNPRADDRMLDVLRLAHERGVAPDDLERLTGRLRYRIGANLERAQDEAATLAGISARAAQGLAEVARMAPGFPVDRFLTTLPAPVPEAETVREALIEVLMRERAERARETQALRDRIAELEARAPQ